MNIRGSIHDDAQIMSSSTLSLLPDFVFIATRAACLPQNAFSNCILFTTGYRLRENFLVATISNA